MSSNTNIGNTPVNQGYVQLVHMGETGGIDGTLRTLYDGDGTASDLQIASNKVKISTELYIGSKTITEYVQDVVGDMFDTNGSHTNITATYDDDGDGAIDLVSTGEVTLTGTQTLSNKTLTSPIIDSVTISTIQTGSESFADNDTSLMTSAAINDKIGTEVASLVDSAPSSLDTLNELAAALGDDANFSTTVTNNIATKLAKASNLSDLANASTARSNLGVDAAGTDNSTNVTLAGSLDYITLSGQEITRNAINLTTDVTGTLPVGNGGTGLTSISTLLNSNVTPTSLGLVIGTNVLAQQTIGIANDNLVEIDDADAADNDYAKFTANGLEGRSYVEVRSDLGLGTLAQKSEIDDIDQIAAGVKLVAGESFVDSDANLMTAAAINDRIESFGYGTGNGDMTGVSITASNPLDISQSNTTSGNYSATISLDASEFGSYLTDMTDLVAGDTDELAILDNGTLKRKQIDEIRLTAFDATGFSSGISFDGSTANGVLTYKDSDEATVESNLTFDGSTLALTGDETISSSLVVGATAKIATTGGTGASQVLGTGNSDTLFTIGRFSNNTGVGTINFLKSRNGTIGSSTIVQDGDGMGAIVWAADDGTDFVSHAAKIDARIDGTPGANDTPGRLSFYTTADGSQSAVERMRIDSSGNVIMQPTKKLYLDGGGDTYITEAAADLVDMYVGAEHALRIADFGNTPYVYVPDNAYLGAGSGIDFSIRHDGSNTYITNSTGDMLFVERDAGNIIFRNNSGTERLKIDSSGDVKITESLGIGVAASSTTGRLDCSNDVVAYSTSDKRLKENIKPLDNALDKVLKISGVEFDWKELTEEEKKTIHGNEGHDVGVIAQEVEEVLPEVVTERDTGYKAVKYEKIVPILIEAIKEQQKQIEELKNG